MGLPRGIALSRALRFFPSLVQLTANLFCCRLAHDQNCWYHWAVLTTITDDRCKSFEDAVYALLKTVQRKINEGLEINCDRSVSTFFAFLVIFCSRYFEKVPDVDTFLYFKTLLKLPYAILAGDLRRVIFFRARVFS